jgi:type IX secretion system PorP/SprF family membrane protein
MNRIALISLFALAGVSTRAQDYFYSQFYNQPLMINPALTGQFRGDFRVSGHYRSQWSALGEPFLTPSAAFDSKVIKQAGSRNYLAAGGYVLHDKAGKSGLSNFHIAANTAYNLAIDRKSSLAFGLQAAYIQRSISFDGLAWDSQYDGTIYDPSRPTGEFFAAQKTSGLDLAAGVVYSKEINRDMELVAGLAQFHYRQRQSFLGTDLDRLYGRQTLYAHLDQRTDLLDITYHFRLFKQSRALMLETGAQAVYRLGTDSRHSNINRSSGIIGGFYYRLQDAASIHAGFEFRRAYQAFVSYDVNLSKLRIATGMRGGFEICLVYKDWFVRKQMKVIR